MKETNQWIQLKSTSQYVKNARLTANNKKIFLLGNIQKDNRYDLLVYKIDKKGENKWEDLLNKLVFKEDPFAFGVYKGRLIAACKSKLYFFQQGEFLLLSYLMGQPINFFSFSLLSF